MSGPPRLTQKPLTIAPKARQMTLPRSPVPLIVCVAIIVLRDAFATFMAVIRSCSRIGTCRWVRDGHLHAERRARGLFSRIGLTAAHLNSLSS
jgi:hypothetical protein